MTRRAKGAGSLAGLLAQGEKQIDAGCSRMSAGFGMKLRPLLADPQRLAPVPGGREVLDHLAERRAALAPVARRLADLTAAGHPLLRDLAASFVHLHCNRLLGTDPAPERLVLGLLLRARESLDRAPLPRA